MNKRKRSKHTTVAGTAAVEAVLIMSVLLSAIIGGIETARAFWTYNTMVMAVEQAGRYAMMYKHRPPAICMPQTQASQCPALSNTPLANCTAWYAQQMLAAYRAPAVVVSVAIDTATSPATIAICASYSFAFIASQLLPYGPLDLMSSVTVPMI